MIRPQGEPSLLQGVCIVLAGWLVIATVGVLLS